ncbi:hypothetical protein LPJ66_007216 [Kickxella alabastrina]|uniref:Uncharacterized protein n=1 Tax=Kickxella alabastrina TaxID=61397 RepID=A0ACC1IA45_9FUNG|nr:hypothetical protein LPJ66_007216 [Kickxella alabastrina]
MVQYISSFFSSSSTVSNAAHAHQQDARDAMGAPPVYVNPDANRPITLAIKQAQVDYKKAKADHKSMQAIIADELVAINSERQAEIERVEAEYAEKADALQLEEHECARQLGEAKSRLLELQRNALTLVEDAFGDLLEIGVLDYRVLPGGDVAQEAVNEPLQAHAAGLLPSGEEADPAVCPQDERCVPAAAAAAEAVAQVGPQSLSSAELARAHNVFGCYNAKWAVFDQKTLILVEARCKPTQARINFNHVKAELTRILPAKINIHHLSKVSKKKIELLVDVMDQPEICWRLFQEGWAVDDVKDPENIFANCCNTKTKKLSELKLRYKKESNSVSNIGVSAYYLYCIKQLQKHFNS